MNEITLISLVTALRSLNWVQSVQVTDFTISIWCKPTSLEELATFQDLTAGITTKTLFTMEVVFSRKDNVLVRIDFD